MATRDTLIIISNTMTFNTDLNDNKRETVLKAKVEHLMMGGYSESYIDAVLLSQGYSVNELKTAFLTVSEEKK